MKVIRTEDAIGMVLGHDITEIVPGKFKGAAFRKGHIIQKEDIERLLRIGKEHIYILEVDENHLHEDDAIKLLGDLFCGNGIYYTEPVEGKINIKAKHKGLLKINKEVLDTLNNLGDISIATIHENRYVNEDDLVAGSRVIPLIIEKEKIDIASEVLKDRGSIFNIKPFKKYETAIIVTGSEVYKGRIKDKAKPTIERKLKFFGSEICYSTIVPDDLEMIKEEIIKSKEMGAELIIVTGGMSVDPDDQTPKAIRDVGTDIITYGTPILPGAMLLFGYLDNVPVFGLPANIIFAPITAFDLIIPRVLAGEKIEKEDITKLGYGGLCLNCEVCTFPNCHFGK